VSAESDRTTSELVRAVANRLADAAEAIHGGADRTEIEKAVTDLRTILRTRFQPRVRARRGEGARTIIRSYLLDRVGQDVDGEELAEVSGIQEWARRLRELRVEEGYNIVEVRSSVYRLLDSTPDGHAAERWRLMNEIRRRPGSAINRISDFLAANVGVVLRREDIDYVANIAEGSRRVRELRDERGWPIASHIDDPSLQPGEYRLLSAAPEDRRDPLQRLYPEGLRQKVFERDNYTCGRCGRNRAKAEAAGDTRFYLEVHHKTAIAEEVAALPKAERNRIENLETLCHDDHLTVTARFQRRRRNERRSES
jgi:hypothetical protein